MRQQLEADRAGGHNFITANNQLPLGVREPWADGLTNQTAGDFTVSDLTKPFGPNWAVSLLPYLEQQPLFNACNTIGYPGIPGPFTTPDGNTVPNANLYNMDWACPTVITARLNVFLCPSDSYNDSGGFLSSPSDLGLGVTPTDQRSGTQLVNWGAATTARSKVVRIVITPSMEMPGPITTPSRERPSGVRWV